MRICLFDDVATGHHPAYAAGVASAAVDAGHVVIAATPTPPSTLDSLSSWIPSTGGPIRHLLRNRRIVGHASRTASALNVDAIWDLYFDRNAWTFPTSTSHIGTQLHVIHHAAQYDLAARDGLGRVRSRLLNGKIDRLIQGGAFFAVHTQRAMHIMSHYVPADQLLLVGYPIRVRERTTNSSPTGPFLLFVGAGRGEKGLDLLLNALEKTQPDAPLLIVGRQPGTLQGQMAAAYPKARVEWINEYVTEHQLDQFYRSASLAILPYRQEFYRHGGPSSVLLETLAYGVPLVTTPALAEQLPRDYRGAVVVPGETADDLGSGISQALDSLGTLRRFAMRDGPAFVQLQHSFGRYVHKLASVTSQ